MPTIDSQEWSNPRESDDEIPTRALSTAQRQAYDTDGFVVVPGVFSATELGLVDREIDRLLPEHEDQAGHRPGWIFGVDELSDITERIASDERIVTLIEDIVQPGIAIHSVKLVAKMPHSNDICHWHQDEAFYRKPDNPATHSATRMSAWVPLQDSDEHNGCLWVVPGSHMWGVKPFVQVDHGQCRRKLTMEEYANEHAKSVPVEAGSVVLFSAWTWHHSKNNVTDHVRRAFITSYQEAAVTGGGASSDHVTLRPEPHASV